MVRWPGKLQPPPSELIRTAEYDVAEIPDDTTKSLCGRDRPSKSFSIHSRSIWLARV